MTTVAHGLCLGIFPLIIENSVYLTKKKNGLEAIFCDITIWTQPSKGESLKYFI